MPAAALGLVARLAGILSGALVPAERSVRAVGLQLTWWAATDPIPVAPGALRRGHQFELAPGS